MRSSELQTLIDIIPDNFADPGADYQAVGEMMAPFHGHPLLEGTTAETLSLDGVKTGHIWDAGSQDSHAIILHFHGGAFVSCSLDAYLFYGEIITQRLGAQVMIPDYRLAPEQPYPAAHDDCFNAYKGLIESGIDPARICVMGESCGGSLAIGTLLQARDQGLAMPACFVSLTGWFDLSVSGQEFEERDPFLTADWVRNRATDYLAGKVDHRDQRVSPAFADLTGLPPMYLQLAQYDTVREGVIQLAANAVRDGVEVTLESWPGLIHGWHGLVNAGVPEAELAWTRIRAYVERRCNKRDSTKSTAND
ncbi:MAG: alpha/beta hydrolase [Pseudomonadales bacterium]